MVFKQTHPTILPLWAFKKEHNHDLVPHEQAHMLPSQRKVTATQAIEVDMAYKYGIQQKLYE